MNYSNKKIYLYLLKINDNLIKIGITKNIKQRLYDQTCNGYIINIDDSYIIETKDNSLTRILEKYILNLIPIVKHNTINYCDTEIRDLKYKNDILTILKNQPNISKVVINPLNNYITNIKEKQKRSQRKGKKQYFDKITLNELENIIKIVKNENKINYGFLEFLIVVGRLGLNINIQKYIDVIYDKDLQNLYFNHNRTELFFSQKNKKYLTTSLNRLLSYYNKKYNLGYINLTTKSISKSKNISDMIEKVKNKTY